MEGSFGSEAPVPANTDINHHFTRSDSDASSLTADNRKDIFRRSENVSQAEFTAWTNEKHNSYLYHLEMSFVEQLYQSKSVLAQCSGQNLRDINMSKKQLISLNKSSEQYNVLQKGCWQKINCALGEPISSSTSADSGASLESRKRFHYKHRGLHCHPSPAKVPTLLKLSSTWKQGKAMIYNGIQTCPHEFSSSNCYNGDLIDLTREGMGQNFMDEDNQSTLNVESRAKRLKTALWDGSHQAQIVPSSKYPTADYSESRVYPPT